MQNNSSEVIKKRGRPKKEKPAVQEVMPKVENKNSIYSITLSLGRDKFNSESESLLEALKKIDIKNLKSKGFIRVEKGKLMSERFLPMLHVLRFFSPQSLLSKEIKLSQFSKFLESTLK